MNMVLLLTLLSTFSLACAQDADQDMREMWGSESVEHETGKQEMKDWFRESKYAMFIHWGLYSHLANKWQGETYYGISEWIMRRKRISVADYEQVADSFNPVNFDAEEWVQLAVDAGMKYIVITAKHHDGFAMYKSLHPYNIVDRTPFKRDPMKELADACKEKGIKLGFYYSQFQDWHEINSWDAEHENESFEDYFNNKCHPQVKELLGNYGPLALIWFDTPGPMTKEQSLSLVELARTLQPQALINSRIGNGVGDYSTNGDQEIPPKNIPGLWETINTTNDSWGYSWYDENWKSPAKIAQDLVTVIARGGNYMLNIGPLADGSLPATISDYLRTSGSWVKLHGHALYGASPSPWQRAFPWGDCTVKGNTLYLFVFNWTPGAELKVFGLNNKILSAVINDEIVTFTQEDDGWTTFHLPMRKQQQLIEMITVKVKGTPDVNVTLSVDDSAETLLLPDFAETSKSRLSTSSWMEKFGEWKHIRTLSNWDPNAGQASWDVHVKKPGKYFVEIIYNAFGPSHKNEWDIFSENNSRLRFYSLNTTGAPQETGWENIRYYFRTKRAGILHLSKAGRQTITITAASKLKGDGMQLQALKLIPVGE